MKGQYSTFMKPIIIMIFGGLLMSLLMSSLNFNIGVTQDRSQIEFQASPTEDFTAVANCLSVDEGVSGSDYLLNQSKLERMDRNYNLREPECAENFVNGYQVEVSQDYLRSVEVDRIGSKIDLAFVMDTSGSMSDDWNDLCNIQSEVVDSLEEDGADVEFTVYGLSSTQNCADESISSLHLESWGPGTEWLVNNHEWRSGSKKVIFPMSDECPKNGDGCGSPDDSSIQSALNALETTEIEVYPIWGSGGGSQVQGYMQELAEATDGEASYKGDASDLAEFIVGAAGGGGETYVGGKGTCSIPPVRSYNASAQIVITADASDDYDREWETICNKVSSKVEELEAKGLKTNVSYYAPGNPGGVQNGKGTPMQISGGEYDMSDRIPSCVSSPDNNAVDSNYGKGITEWSGEGLTDYNSSKDYGLEAWGVSSKWILENHDWNQSVDRRMLFVFGDQDPTGGNATGEDFRTEQGTDILDNETEIVRNVSNLSNSKNVNVYPVNGGLEYSALDVYGDEEKNDALEMIQLLDSETDGSQIVYETIDNIPTKFQEQFRDLSEQESGTAGTCQNVNYTFGETQGSEGSNLEASLTSRFPASVRQSDKLTTPATVDITLRKGSLEKLAGAINKAISNGEKFDENVSVYADINNDETLMIENREIERDQKTTYQLQTPGGNTDIDIEDDLMIGVNGRTVFQDRDQSPSTIDFSDSDNQFKAYKGASLQVIALNTVAPELKLPELELSCVNGCGQTQTINPDLIQASEGEQRYVELGGLGPFYHNFTEVEIGKVEETEERSLCYSGSDNCVVLRSEDIEDYTLRPGSHEVLIRYSPSEGVSFQ